MNNAAYNEALRHFNRVGGQLKRHHNIDPASYLEGVHTEKGIKRALDQMRFDAEREDIDRDIEEYERRLEEALEDELKEEDLLEKERQYEEARDTLNENYDLDWDETDSQIFWDAFDDSDIIDAFGSTQILDMGNAAMKNNNITTKQAAEIAKRTAGQLLGKGLTNEQKRDSYDDNIAAYTALRSGPNKMTHKGAIRKLFE